MEGGLPAKIVRLLVDQLILLDNIRGKIFKGEGQYIELSGEGSISEEITAPAKNIYFDYGFLIAPAYKAFEGYLIFLAGEFGLPVKKYSKNIGGLYNWETNKKHKELILEKLKEKFGEDRQGQDRWGELDMVLKTYRHNPAHYLGDTINTFEKGENFVRTIINTINQSLDFILKKKAITANERTNIEEICTFR